MLILGHAFFGKFYTTTNLEFHKVYICYMYQNDNECCIFLKDM